jgi:hypothetical protein
VNLRGDLPAMLEAVTKRKLDLGSVATTVVSRAEAASTWTETATKLVIRM